MKLTIKTIKWVPILVLLLLASPLILLKGCGKAVNGGPSGACPDTVAPSGSTITPAATSASLEASFVGMINCYSPVVFNVADTSGALNGICVEITTDAAIALHTLNDPLCSNVLVPGGAKNTIITRTDEHGNISLDLVTQPTASGDVFFVEITSGSVQKKVETAPAVPPPS